MEHQIRRFAEQCRIVLHHGGERGFHALFAHFLGDTAYAFIEQLRRITSSRTLAFAPFNRQMSAEVALSDGR